MPQTYLPPSELPETDLARTVEETRRLYVARLFCDLEPVRQMVDTTVGMAHIYGAAILNGTVWSLGSEYATTIEFNAISRGRVDDDTTDIRQAVRYLREEDAQRLAIMEEFAALTHTGFSRRALVRLSRKRRIDGRGPAQDRIFFANRRTLLEEQQIITSSIKKLRR